MRIILLTSGAVLLFTCASFFTYEILTFRRTAVRQLATLGEVIASNSTAALAFDNVDDARETLSALRADRHIVAAALYTAEGKLFARYPAAINAGEIPTSPDASGYRMTRNALASWQPVIQNERRLGTLYLRSDMGAMAERLRLYAAIVLLVAACSLLVAFGVSQR
ncbi:MAG: CHASE sensor domain-containing protein, partial [Opitutus sp.]